VKSLQIYGIFKNFSTFEKSFDNNDPLYLHCNPENRVAMLNCKPVPRGAISHCNPGFRVANLLQVVVDLQLQF